MKDYTEELKAAYQVVADWWNFCKSVYPKSRPSDEEIDKWIQNCEAKQKEMAKTDKGLAWLYRRLGIVFMDYCLKRQEERQGRKVDWG